MSSKPWANGLITILNDPTTHIISSNLAAVINDKYPKAKHHYLVLPFEDIPTIFDLNKSHFPILEELYLLALNVIEVRKHQKENFLIGFHNQPSMLRLHLHVISKDFISDCLKNKKHWNSFNTRLFLTYDEVCLQLKESGHVKRLDSRTIGRLSKVDLKCNQCEFLAKNMPTLKEHLMEHLN